MNILINNETMHVAKVTPTLEQAICWADIVCPQGDFTIVGESEEHYKGYTDYELRLILKSVDAMGANANVPRENVIHRIKEGAQHLGYDETPLEDLQSKLGLAAGEMPHISLKPASTSPAGKSPSTKIKKSGGESSAVLKRPAAGTATGRVWEIIDDLITARGDGALVHRDLVVEAGVKEGLNESTVKTQYSKYRRWYNEQES